MYTADAIAFFKTKAALAAAAGVQNPRFMHGVSWCQKVALLA